jgi:hypothetical protein
MITMLVVVTATTTTMLQHYYGKFGFVPQPQYHLAIYHSITPPPLLASLLKNGLYCTNNSHKSSPWPVYYDYQQIFLLHTNDHPSCSNTARKGNLHPVLVHHRYCINTLLKGHRKLDNILLQSINGAWNTEPQFVCDFWEVDGKRMERDVLQIPSKRFGISNFIEIGFSRYLLKVSNIQILTSLIRLI